MAVGLQEHKQRFLAEVTKIQAKALSEKRYCILLWQSIVQSNSQDQSSFKGKGNDFTACWKEGQISRGHLNCTTSRITYCLKLQFSLCNLNLEQQCSFLFYFYSTCFNQLYLLFFNVQIVSSLANRYSLKLTSVSIK